LIGHTQILSYEAKAEIRRKWAKSGVGARLGNDFQGFPTVRKDFPTARQSFSDSSAKFPDGPAKFPDGPEKLSDSSANFSDGSANHPRRPGKTCRWLGKVFRRLAKVFQLAAEGDKEHREANTSHASTLERLLWQFCCPDPKVAPTRRLPPTSFALSAPRHPAGW
jgi:hypothetical protein